MVAFRWCPVMWPWCTAAREMNEATHRNESLRSTLSLRLNQSRGIQSQVFSQFKGVICSQRAVAVFRRTLPFIGAHASSHSLFYLCQSSGEGKAMRLGSHGAGVGRRALPYATVFFVGAIWGKVPPQALGLDRQPVSQTPTLTPNPHPNLNLNPNPSVWLTLV